VSRKLEYLFLLGCSLFAVTILAYLNYVSVGVEGGMDSYNHYLIAKYSWEHPHLFLDYWGKPIYNILASPFVQFGLDGAFVFNLLCLLGSSVLAYLSARTLGLRYAWLAFLLTLLSPIFLDQIISSLTEPLSALLVMLTLYLIIRQKWMTGAVLAGLLPFARSEGFVVLAVVIIYYLWQARKWQHFAALFTGSIFFNLLGWSITGKPFWVITENPYINFELSGNNVCGSGGLFHYFWVGHYTFSLAVCGLLVIAAFFIVKNNPFKQPTLSLLLAVFIGYFGAHAFIWWQGMMGSCGYVRVMSVISAPAAILSVYALHQGFDLLPQKYGYVQKAAVLLIVLNAFYTPYRYYAYKYPLQISEEQEQYVKLAEWYKQQPFENRTKLYLYPYFSIIADINPYDQNEHLDLWQSSLQWTKKGDILIWDGHFGPNESGLPLDTLEANPAWKKIHSIIPEKPILTLNDYHFEIHVFEKVK
jgi:hypothetical protein